MLTETQQKNYTFFSDHLPKYLEDPIKKNKYGIFCDEALQGLYDSFEAAYIAACAKFAMGDFIIQQIVDPAKIVGFLWTAGV